MIGSLDKQRGLLTEENQTGEVADPVITPRGDGHMVKVTYTDYTPDRAVLWIYDLSNTTWHGVEVL